MPPTSGKQELKWRGLIVRLLGSGFGWVTGWMMNVAGLPRRREHGASVIKTRRKAAVNFGTKECASDFVAMADDEAIWMDSTDG